MKDYQAVLDYWFGDGSDPARRQRELWFAGSARVDADVRERFLPEVEHAERGERRSQQIEGAETESPEREPVRIRRPAHGFAQGNQSHRKILITKTRRAWCGMPAPKKMIPVNPPCQADVALSSAPCPPVVPSSSTWPSSRRWR